MTETPTSRFGIAAISGSDYIHDIDTEDQAEVLIIDQKAAGFNVGTLATRPAAGKTGWFYFATDTRTLYYDAGDSWWQISGGMSSFHSWTTSDQTFVDPTATMLGSMFIRPRPGETVTLLEAVIHCEVVGDVPSVLKVQTDHGHHGTLADVPGLAALQPSTTPTAVSAEAPVTMATLDRVAIKTVTAGDSRGWSVQVVYEHLG